MKEEKKEYLSQVSDVVDESDRNGMRAVIKLKKDADAKYAASSSILLSRSENSLSNNLIELADIDAAAQIDFEVSGTRPQINFCTHIQRNTSIFRRPHIDRRVGDRIHLDLRSGHSL